MLWQNIECGKIKASAKHFKKFSCLKIYVYCFCQAYPISKKGNTENLN